MLTELNLLCTLPVRISLPSPRSNHGSSLPRVFVSVPSCCVAEHPPVSQAFPLGMAGLGWPRLLSRVLAWRFFIILLFSTFKKGLLYSSSF